MPANLPPPFPVIGIGASAGGLAACSRLLDAMPADHGMAMILVQHLDPNHASLMVDLLQEHTTMTVVEATDGMHVVPNHLYAIPPGVYLSVKAGALHLSEPVAGHGARLPLDFLLRAMATEYGARSVAVILSGFGADGSDGLQAIHAEGGFVIVQDPAEAQYKAMPQNAIDTGLVDLILPLARIPQAMLDHAAIPLQSAAGLPGPDHATATGPAGMADQALILEQIIDLLHRRTSHDFSLYKTGTLQRRINRRIAMAIPKLPSMAAYLAMLQASPDEVTQLAADLLIHVTRFFRDPAVFGELDTTILPGLIAGRDKGGPLRIWVAGCSTGEETYSLAMLLVEHIEAMARPPEDAIELKLFASDIDAAVVATARAGAYPSSIEAQIPPDRLARHFIREGAGYTVRPSLRQLVVFSVQDLLSDPPFSRLDMISCRNLLIYLRPEAQARLISIFHFALKPGGLLLLGNAETTGPAEDMFEVVHKTARLYRTLPGHPGLPAPLGKQKLLRPPQLEIPSVELSAPRATTLASLCRRLVLESYAPAALLVNRRRQCIYSLGPIDRYLRMAPGVPSNDVLAMARPGLRTPLRVAIEQAIETQLRVASDYHPALDDDQQGFRIEVHPVHSDGQALLLICFVDMPQPALPATAADPADPQAMAVLRQKLETSRIALSRALGDLARAGEEHAESQQEALSVNEEYQSTNEELLASKEELQSLNEELTALNSQLQETLQRSRVTSNDLQNVLFSTDVATLCLDTHLCVRFFTPTTRVLFNLIASDVGRPITDLNALTIHGSLPEEARQVIASGAAHETELLMPSGIWFQRRILPYRTHENAIAGVVITFTDITERKSVARALEEAKLQADIANHAKSRFLAAASHDLRQPLQTLALLSGVLGKSVISAESKALVTRLDEALSGISGMLNTLLDINEIETGGLKPDLSDFPLGTLLASLHAQFSLHAEAQSIGLRMVACSVVVHSDPRLLEQMIRNLLSNALKYTSKGRVLLGCRRRPGVLSIEVWDTGVGIPEREHKVIFEEYYQLNNASRDRSRGLGLGLSIVSQLAAVLGHSVRVCSVPGRGSCFAIDIALPVLLEAPKALRNSTLLDGMELPSPPIPGEILLIEDDLSVRDLLAQLLIDEGHRVTAVSDGVTAMELVQSGQVVPDLILTDFNLPNHMDGLKVTAALRAELDRKVPSIVLTGDISKETLRNIAAHGSVQLNKPIKPVELLACIQRALAAPVPQLAPPPAPPRPEGTPVIRVIDDDTQARGAMRLLFEQQGYACQTFATAEAFLASPPETGPGCVLIDAVLPGMSGLDLLRTLTAQRHAMPSIMITGHSDVPMAVAAMKGGAIDFIDKPASADDLLRAIALALTHARDAGTQRSWQEAAQRQLDTLTDRQKQIMRMVLDGHPSKNIAADLGISQRTVENHRAAIMHKTGAKSLPALARLALQAAELGSAE